MIEINTAGYETVDQLLQGMLSVLYIAMRFIDEYFSLMNHILPYLFQSQEDDDDVS